MYIDIVKKASRKGKEMKAAEHYELFKKYHAEAIEWLHKSMNHKYAFEGTEEFAEYCRLEKIANKHYGIYKGVVTRRLNKSIA